MSSHQIEIWLLVREDGTTVYSAVCLSCGWLSEEGPRAGAEVEALRHQSEDEAAEPRGAA